MDRPDAPGKPDDKPPVDPQLDEHGKPDATTEGGGVPVPPPPKDPPPGGGGS